MLQNLVEQTEKGMLDDSEQHREVGVMMKK